MRHLIVASHAHFSKGLMESLEFVFGAQEGVRVLTAFVDGCDDLEAEVEKALSEVPAEDDVIVCTDVLGGSVNNEFLKHLVSRPGLHVITNMNLPLLLQLSCIDDGNLADSIRSVVSSPEVRPTYCNEILSDIDDEDEF